MLVAGIALGALLGPGPAVSLANGSRAAVVARLLALMALDGAGQSGQTLLSATSQGPAASPQPSSASAQPSAQSSSSAGGGANSHAGVGGDHAAQSETGSAPAAENTPSSPTRHTTASPLHRPARLPAIGHTWLIVLPYGENFAKVLAEPAAFPFLSGELRQGTLLNSYSALAAQQLEGAAALLSGAVESAANTIEPPSEPAGAQTADAFLQSVVGEITATAAYSEGGLIAIAFAGAPNAPATPPAQPAPGQTQTSTPNTQAGGEARPASGQPQPTPYPPGTQASTLSATTTGTLLLSPYLRRPGARLASTFDAAAPRASIEELLSTSKNVGR
jgi:hypothetical protein